MGKLRYIFKKKKERERKNAITICSPKDHLLNIIPLSKAKWLDTIKTWMPTFHASHHNTIRGREKIVCCHKNPGSSSMIHPVQYCQHAHDAFQVNSRSKMDPSLTKITFTFLFYKNMDCFTNGVDFMLHGAEGMWSKNTKPMHVQVT